MMSICSYCKKLRYMRVQALTEVFNSTLLPFFLPIKLLTGRLMSPLRVPRFLWKKIYDDQQWIYFNSLRPVETTGMLQKTLENFKHITGTPWPSNPDLDYIKLSKMVTFQYLISANGVASWATTTCLTSIFVFPRKPPNEDWPLNS